MTGFTRGQIELKRKELYSLYDKYGLASELVLLKSQELDHLLNQYGRSERELVVK
ncbi:aspartyl-phosphate phosphatase Spo0E family protein [Paenibacillus albus]|uniref:Aspartyl-phosphate phosphatase Spo0E family protein n=1 Tax=Paenibacillus albus TaxID=2495582 RepID=A0A3Q8X7D1_9BACL|nr:aspartyl-phosphate phosphatase Spo0E family protein [Paenibacillus albus]AZN41356.1 aspartyl-phosphate phosphatase Spo0E family protein [Paenibacillus albus]